MSQLLWPAVVLLAVLSILAVVVCVRSIKSDNEAEARRRRDSQDKARQLEGAELRSTDAMHGGGASEQILGENQPKTAGWFVQSLIFPVLGLSFYCACSMDSSLQAEYGTAHDLLFYAIWLGPGVIFAMIIWGRKSSS